MPNHARDRLLNIVEERYAGMKTFRDVLQSTFADLFEFIDADGNQQHWSVLEYLSQPDRVITFRVAWQDDAGTMQFNQGYRVQYCNVLGPYKGGLRFSPHVNLDTFHFLAFKQTFKNALTGLSMGGAKGGADFDPHGKSDREIKRFCQAFMTQLHRYIGAERDIPAGDIGVGTQEVAYLFDHYKAVTGEFTGVLTGKHPVFGGSCLREEATGHGCVYFARYVLEHQGKDIAGQACAVSGAGNVALFTAEKLLDLDAKVISLSDSKGLLHFSEGMDRELLDRVRDARKTRKSLKEIADKFSLDYHENKKPWVLDCLYAFPCATENEIDGDDAKSLAKSGCHSVFEGANMPTSNAAKRVFHSKHVQVVPSNAVNAGGVAVSGLEITQNRTMQSWSSERVEENLKQIMAKIHQSCVDHGQTEEGVDYERGANIAAFRAISKALQMCGSV